MNIQMNVFSYYMVCVQVAHLMPSQSGIDLYFFLFGEGGGGLRFRMCVFVHVCYCY